MSKSKEELNKLKEEVESVNEKLQELTPEEIAQVSGGGLLAHCGVGGVHGHKPATMATATVADLEKHGLGKFGGAVATQG